MQRHTFSRRTAAFRLRELEGWTFSLTVGPHGSELEGRYATDGGGVVKAQVTGLQACGTGPSVTLRLDGRYTFQVEASGVADPDEAVAAFGRLLSVLGDGEVTAVRSSSRVPAPVAARRGC